MFLWGKIPEKYADVEELTERVLHEAKDLLLLGSFLVTTANGIYESAFVPKMIK